MWIKVGDYFNVLTPAGFAPKSSNSAKKFVISFLFSM
jgi:hypothetical protein